MDKVQDHRPIARSERLKPYYVVHKHDEPADPSLPPYYYAWECMSVIRDLAAFGEGDFVFTIIRD